MAFNSNTPRQEFTATGGQTVFNFNFKIFNTSNMVVYKTPSGQTPDDATDKLTETTHYAVTIDGDNGGVVTLNAGATNGDSITLLRELPFTRETDYQTNGDLLANTIDEDQDYQTYLSQQLETSKTRFLNIPESVQGVDASLPAPSGDAYFKWSADGLSIENDTTLPEAVTTSTANATAAATSATEAQLSEWIAQAERLTADSYATEPEDTFVNLVTSDGDGTFTYTPTTEYSALHWAAKSSSGDIAPLIHTATSKTTPVDADEFAITDSAATFGLKKLTWANIKTALTALFAPLASPTFTGTPTAPTASAGTNTTQIATTAFVKAKSEADSIGVNQTWQDVKASRSIGVTYTNSTGKPIYIYVICSVNTNRASMAIDGVTIEGNDIYAAGEGGVFSFVIPNGSLYRLNSTNIASIDTWSELR